jgi:prepilin-type N-terminal cleavage/methylation domain-containing protein
MLKTYYKQQGFSLVEMAIVLIILGFVLTALLLPLRAQREQAAQLQTINTLENAKQALLGFAQANGRLPCPAVAGSGIAAPNASGACTQQVGFLPAATLGLQPINAQGFAIDAWNNPIRYSVTQNDVNLNTGVATLNPVFTTSNGMSNAGITNLSQSATLRVCASSSAFATTCTAPPVSNETNYLINNAVAVIFSTGATASQGAGSPDEAENLDADAIFVSRDISQAVAPNEFDHIVTWISPYVLYNAMIQAGQLH